MPEDIKDLAVPVAVIADLFDVSERRVQDYVSDDNMPKLARGEYNLFDCVRWKIKKLERENEMLKNSGNETRYAEQLKGDRYKNMKLAQDMLKSAGHLVEAEDVRIAWTTECNALRTALKGLIPDLTAALDNVQDDLKRKEIITKKIHSVAKYIAEELTIEVEDDGASIPDAKASVLGDLSGADTFNQELFP